MKSNVARNNFFFRLGRELIEIFQSHVHHSSTVVKNENIYFLGEGRVRFKKRGSSESDVP